VAVKAGSAGRASVFLVRPSSQQSWNGPDSHVYLRWVPGVPGALEVLGAP